MHFQDIPIRRKLMVMLLFTSGAVLALTCAFFFAYEVLTFRRSTVSQLATLGEVVASNSTAALAFQSAEDATVVLSALRADRHIVHAGIYRADNSLFARYPAHLKDDVFPVLPQSDGHRFEGGGLSSFQPVVENGKRLGTLYLRADLGAVRERLQLYGGTVLVVIAASCALAYFLSQRLQRQISEPLLALESTARAISDRQDYSVRASKQTGGEIGRLTDAFNLMLTQIQQLNQELEARVQRRTAQLEDANRELEAFSYSVSHDLRAPLRHIGGFATMLERHAHSVLDEKGRRYVTVILESTQRMGRLIDDLLAFCRNGRAEPRRLPVNLDELMADVRANLQNDIGTRTVDWKIGSLPTVLGDMGLLRQVFANLVGNAVKYTRQRAEAQIQIGVETTTSTEVVVFVRDNGAGFDMKYADKLFGVFQRLHQDEEFEGTGVGLATVRRIVQRHGGRVWADAACGVGATFFVALPRVGPAEEKGSVSS